MSINNVSLVGRTTRTPKILENKNGKTVLLTLAVERSYKDKEGNRPVDYVQVKGFIPAGAKSNGPFDYIGKGQLIAIEGEVRSSVFEKDGETVYSQDIIIKQNGVHLIERSKVDNKGEATEETVVEPEIEEELPF